MGGRIGFKITYVQARVLCIEKSAKQKSQLCWGAGRVGGEEEDVRL